MALLPVASAAVAGHSFTRGAAARVLPGERSEGAAVRARPDQELPAARGDVVEVGRHPERERVGVDVAAGPSLRTARAAAALSLTPTCRHGESLWGRGMARQDAMAPPLLSGRAWRGASAPSGRRLTTARRWWPTPGLGASVASTSVPSHG
jgi:hypothetical protein